MGNCCNESKVSTYGDATISQDAHVVQGNISNVSNDVHIGGDLHLHFKPRLSELDIASTIIEFQELSRKLLAFGSTIQGSQGSQDRGPLAHLDDLNRDLDPKHAAQLGTLCDELDGVLDRLTYHRAASMTVDHGEIETEHVYSILISAYEAAIRIARYLCEVNDLVKSRPAEPLANLHTANSSHSLQRFKYTAVSETQAEQTKWRLDVRQLFLRAWKQHNLANELQACLRYHEQLNKRLHGLINDREGSSGSTRQGNDIVQVLSMNRNVRHTLRAFGAMYTRQNGESFIAATPFNEVSPSAGQSMSLIKYDLSNHGPADQSELHPLIENIPHFVFEIRKMLSFREEHDRRTDIKDAHKRTFGWILNPTNTGPTSHFRTWLKSGDDLFWIGGKAGSGKSTLMKFIHQHHLVTELLAEWSEQKHLVMASFFFWYAGNTLQKSYEGVLRSILKQILDKRPELTHVLFPELSRSFLVQHSPQRKEDDFQLTIRELREAMKLLKRNMPSDLALFLMIDGIDEFLGDHLDFARFLLDIAESPSIKILVSSRPVPACAQVFSSYPNLQLQDLTAPDIRAYVEAELLQNQLLLDMECLEPGFAHEIEVALLEKASGVFLWIYLVVDTLLRGLGQYDHRVSLMQKIDELPSDLEKLYDHMFGKMSREYRKEGSVLLQLMVRASEAQEFHLSAIQLFAAERRHHNSLAYLYNEDYTFEHESLRIKAIEGKLRSRCCGLAEVQYRNAYGDLDSPKVDFLHRTVYDYLRAPDVWEKATKDSGVSLRTINLLLLVSAVHVMKRSPPVNGSSFVSYRVSFVQLFSACLEYSFVLGLAGDSEHVPFLKAADELCVKYSEHMPHTYSSTIFHAASRVFVSRHNLTISDVVHEFDHNVKVDPLKASLMTFAALGFEKYFAAKLCSCTLGTTPKAFLLLYMLVLCTSANLSPSLAAAYSQIIETLLNKGADPNHYIPGVGHNALPAAVQHAASSYVTEWSLTPWNFWLSQPLVKVRHLHTSIQLLRTAPPSTASIEKLVSEFKTKLNYYRRAGIQPEDLSQVDLHALLPPVDSFSIVPQQRKRRREEEEEEEEEQQDTPWKRIALG